MDFFNKQPEDLLKHEFSQICCSCNSEMDISVKQSTIFRDQWYHVLCWRKLVGI